VQEVITVLNLVCLCFRKVKKRVLVNLSRLVCQSLFFGLDFCHFEFFLILEGCSNYKYSIRICNKALLAKI
jgi:hypothetical protein